jgi:hypothetical protein
MQPVEKPDFLAQAKAQAKRQVDSSSELRELYQRLGFNGFDDDGPVKQRCVDYAALEKRLQLDGTLRDLNWVRLEYGADTRYFKETAYEKAKIYVDSPWMHAPWINSFLALAVLDAELAPLTREIRECPSPSLTLTSVYILFSIAGIYFIYDSGWIWIAGLWTAFLVCSLLANIVGSWKLRKRREKLTMLATGLQLIRDEVASGCYCGPEIDSRLRRLEAQGLYVHSLTYPLLRQ